MRNSEATERARRSDSLYYGNVSRRELCNMVARLENEAGLLKKRGDSHAASLEPPAQSASEKK